MFTDKMGPDERVIYNGLLKYLYKADRYNVKTVFHRMNT